MTWDIEGTEVPREFFGRFEPEEILYQFDRPHIFTTRSSSGDLLLAYQCGDEQFLVVPTDAQLIEALRDRRITVRAALEQPRVWLVECDEWGRIMRARSVCLQSVPPDALPRHGVYLVPGRT
jgi:hypothetical protein